MSLRPYQIDALERASAASLEHQSILIQLATGLGKTRLAVEACYRHVERGGRPLFVAPRRELVNQAREALRARGLEDGHDCFVRTIQECTTSRSSVPPATMVVLDEARHYVADEWSKLREALPDAVYMGLDATPERGDGRGLSPFFTTIIEAISIREAIDGGWLVPAEVLRPERALGPRELALDPVDAYLAKAYGTSAVIYAASVELAKEYADRIAGHGLHAAAIWGDMPAPLRDHQIAEFSAGRIRVLTNFQILVEGFDAPCIETIVLARNFVTAGSMLQAVGRGLRPFTGKARCLVLDLVGATHTHGEPDEPRTWHLEGRAVRRVSDSDDVRFCPVCGAPTETKECAQCGYGGEMKKRKPRVLGLPIDRFARQRAEDDETATKKLAQYMRLARTKGYRTGWALFRWEAIYGRKPTTEMVRAARALA